MTNTEIIERVRKWQGRGNVHPLTCGVDSQHDDLVPVEIDGVVVLRCPTCQNIQKRIPDCVFAPDPLREMQPA